MPCGELVGECKWMCEMNLGMLERLDCESLGAVSTLSLTY